MAGAAEPPPDTTALPTPPYDVPQDPRAVGICRRTLRDILTTHHLTDLLEPAELLASELVTNALRHTDGPTARRP